MTALHQGKRRFEAEWIANQHGTDGEWDPDKDEYAVSYHETKEAAEAAAIAASKRAAQCEWILVAEQEFRGYEWVDVRRWTGDWQGLCDLTLDTFADVDP